MATRNFYVVDAFTNRPFAGNPAAVCLLDGPADEQWMKLVAREINLSETAYLWPVEGGFSLRWFTPAVEVRLCGHATLASAAVLWHLGKIGASEVAKFSTKSGWLSAWQDGGQIVMDFPAVVANPCAAPQGLLESLGYPALHVASNGMDYLVEIDSEERLLSLSPDMGKLATLPVRGAIVTSRPTRSDIDFVSRFFAPAAGVNEDPVTGSAHCALAPYWSAKLGKDSLVGFQASERGGTVGVQLKNDRVLLRGDAVLMSRMELYY